MSDPKDLEEEEAHIKQARSLQDKDFSEVAIKTILPATRDTTREVCKGRWESFVSWCGERDENPIRTSLKHVLDILQTKSETLAVNNIKGYVTTISWRHAIVHNNLLSLDPTLKRWIKGLEHSKGIPCMITPTLSGVGSGGPDQDSV